MSGRPAVWALVPARGGSKSVPYKNLLSLAGRPLLDYGVRAAQASGRIDRIIGSTEDARIAERFRSLGVEVDDRPARLAADDTPVAEVAVDMLKRLGGNKPPDILLLVQPTSPFLLPEHITALLQRMTDDKQARSGQTVSPCPHNHHAWNQRVLKDGRIGFVFAEERRRGYNKQAKPKHWVFGNLVGVRTGALLAGEGFFAEPSAAVEIAAPYDFDLDTAEDVKIAEALLSGGVVDLPHMRSKN
jgi:CMP-N,N'-diacetyllegionaminic acid synthase